MLQLIVSFTDAQIRELLLADAKRQHKEHTTKEHTGSNSLAFDVVEVKEGKKEINATVSFQTNSKR